MTFDTKFSPPKAGTNAPAGPSTTGYYRFTDIFFEWHQALPDQDDVSPLKALIAYNSLVHPDHPLRKPGVNGIELYLGTFNTGEMRLLFSSAQIEYMRYWMHKVGLTKEIIPIPASEYLIQGGDLRNCSPDVYRDAAILKRAIKNIDKNNKRLKGMNDLLGPRRQTFEMIRTLWAAKLGTWCAIDFEAWDRDHTLLTEFGWSLVDWNGGQPPAKEHGHLVVTERRKYIQHYVAHNRDYYNFGESEDVDKHGFKDRICELIEKHRNAGPLFLVFHDYKQDLIYLKSDALRALERQDVLTGNPQKGEVYIVDTAELFAALEGDMSTNTRSLDRVCKHLQIPTKFLHNAGNDAYYTLEAMISMASGDPLDEQREKRWPNRTSGSRPKVEFQEWEEDEDLSDLEGIFGFPANSTAHVRNNPDDVDDIDDDIID